MNIKYTYQLKKKAVLAYLNGECGYKPICKQFGISSPSLLIDWVKDYKAFGLEGLKLPKKHARYTFDFKLSVVKSYMNSNKSSRAIGDEFGIHRTLVVRWTKQFQSQGEDALKPSPKGQCSHMAPSKDEINKLKKDTAKLIKKLSKSEGDKDNSQLISELTKKLEIMTEKYELSEKDKLRLSIENAYLKERRRLYLEEEAKMRELRASFTASEETSN